MITRTISVETENLYQDPESGHTLDCEMDISAELRIEKGDNITPGYSEVKAWNWTITRLWETDTYGAGGYLKLTDLPEDIRNQFLATIPEWIDDNYDYLMDRLMG